MSCAKKKLKTVKVNHEFIIRNKREIKRYIPKICKECKDIFVTSNPNKVYCSSKCKKKSRTRRDNKRYAHLPSKKHERWSKEVRGNYSYTCAVCGSTENVEAHHIVPRSFSEELLYTIENGVALCQKCHTSGKYAIHRNEDYWNSESENGFRIKFWNWAFEVKTQI
jgi:5-methylcytosine-specific restriction endonuclease McrA